MPLNIPSDSGPLTYGLDGLLGVGKENPTEKLDVVGNAKVSGSVMAAALEPTAAVSPRCVHTGGGVLGDVNAVAPNTDETYVAECLVPCTMDITGIAIYVASNASGDNVVVYLCDAEGNVVAHSDPDGTAPADDPSFQRIPFTAVYQAQGPATYYVAVQADSSDASFNTHVIGGFGAGKITDTVFGTLASITPPTTFTTALGPVASLY